MKKITLLSFLFIITGLLFIGCEGKEGAQGTIGPKGDTGATGATGANGAAGPAGTSNVIYSDWLAFPEAAFSSMNRKNFEFAAPKITKEILASGQVFGYVKVTTSIMSIPVIHKYVYTSGEVSGSYMSTLNFSEGKVTLNQDWMTSGTIPTDFATAKTVQGGYTNFRYIIVPGGTAARKADKLDYSDYEAVKKYYNWKD